MSTPKKHSRLGYVVALLGGFVMLMATGVLPVDDKNLHSPNAILFLCGLVFLAGGIVLLFPSNRRLKMSMVVVILASFLTIGLWIAFFGDSRYFSGGIPFVSRETNAVLARIAFGVGGAMVFGILLIALKDLLRAFSNGKNDSAG